MPRDPGKTLFKFHFFHPLLPYSIQCYFKSETTVKFSIHLLQCQLEPYNFLSQCTKSLQASSIMFPKMTQIDSDLTNYISLLTTFCNCAIICILEASPSDPWLNFLLYPFKTFLVYLYTRLIYNKFEVISNHICNCTIIKPWWPWLNFLLCYIKTWGITIFIQD